jgi:hypothetical protein
MFRGQNKDFDSDAISVVSSASSTDIGKDNPLVTATEILKEKSKSSESKGQGSR